MPQQRFCNITENTQFLQACHHRHQAEKDRRLYNLYVYQGKWQSCLTRMFSEAEDKPIVPDPKKIDICAPMPDDENKKFWEETEKESALMGERTPKKKTPF